MQKKIDFINEDTKKGFLMMMLPLLVAMFLNMAYNIVDSLWIGNLLGKNAYAALTNSTPIILIMSCIAMGATQGVSILLSQSIGAGDYNRSNRIISSGFISSIIFSLLLTIIVEIILNPVLKLLNTPDSIATMSYKYLSIYILGYIAVYMYCYFTAVLRSYGNSVFQGMAMFICTLLNAILDPIFINIFGFEGAAMATVLTQILCLIFMAIYIKNKCDFKIRIDFFEVTIIRKFIYKGLPSVIQQSIPAISTSFITAFVGSYGITALASFGNIGKIEIILFYPALAINMAITSIVGQCVGAKRFDRVKSYMSISMKSGVILVMVLAFIVVIFSKEISNIFVRSSEVSNMVKSYFKIVGIGYVFSTATNCFLGCLNGLSKPNKSLYCMILSYIAIRIPLAYIISSLLNSIDGIWYGILISHILSILISSVMTNFEMIHQERKHTIENDN